MKSDCERVLLLQAPYGDYTYPYHSLSYVGAVLGAAGYQTDIADLNALWFRSVFSNARLQAWNQEISGELSALQARSSLDIVQQDRLVSLLRALALAKSIRPDEAIEIFRGENFYDPERYAWARQQVRRFEELLTFLYRPYDFFTAFAIPPLEPSATAVVSKARAMNRLIDDLSALLERLFGANRYLFCGVSVPFTTNLVPAMALMIAIGRVFPGTIRVAGGTAVSDIVKYARSQRALAPFGELCEFFYAGEAETALASFAAWCSSNSATRPRQAIALGGTEFGYADPPYVALADSGKGASAFVPYDWRSNPPDYSWINWQLYLSPEKCVNYAPARGCFWNKCTFCDYGLNSDGPTAPARTMDADLAGEHLGALAKAGIRQFYLAADALTPKFLKAFAGYLIEHGIDVGWACQLFLTKNFDADLVSQLSESGLHVASFGLESGSSRVLSRMGKGRDRVEAVLRPVFDVFRSSRVGLQPVFFFGFPGESNEDRHRTVSLLRDNLDIFSTVGKGGVFSLLAASIMARRPGDFGIRCTVSDDDISGVLQYQLEDEGDPPDCRAFKPFNDSLPHSEAFERPWLGGIDTLHTQLYVRRYGRGIFHSLRERDPARRQDSWLDIDLTSPFDLDAVMENVVIYRALQGDITMASALDGVGQHLEADASESLFQVARTQAADYSLKLRDCREP